MIKYVSTSFVTIVYLTEEEAVELIAQTYPDDDTRAFHLKSLLEKTCGCVSVDGGMLEPV